MFLRRIDIVGFKSFADKTSLEFSPGITGVVGPNGSGKSNIADAIRWVLGEQSARNLRGSKMEDVIFAGTEKRKSINYCEVSLTLDNADQHLPVAFAEVTVQRRVYRSGDSEYFINQQACRLKDIHQLFMDSGLGREAYSIIGQGRIEEMLSTRPEDRRGPFEDAAGIVKYRSRRKESERRLDEASANLVRVDDILAELERQAGPLEAEARRAGEYQALAEAWQALDVALLVQQIDVLQQRHHDATSEIQRISLQKTHAEATYRATQVAIGEAQMVAEATREALELRQQHLVRAVEERERSEGQLGVLRERLGNLGATQSDKERQLAAIAAELGQLQAQSTTLDERLQAVAALHVTRTSELEVAARAVDPNVRAFMAAEVAELNSELIEAHQREAGLRNEIRAVQDALVAVDTRRQRIAAERSRWDAERLRIVAETTAAKDRQAVLRAEHSTAVAAVDADKLRLRAGTEQEVGCSSELSRIDAERASLRSKLELLKELEDGYDGYGLGVKSVLQAATGGKLSGIHGALATLITVERRYDVAIETALGAALQNVVVETEADARQAIDFLKRRQAGRATFMPLAVLKSRRLSGHELAKVSQDTGYAGLASDLVVCETRYRHGVEHVLGNVVIASSLADANRMARVLDYRLRIVTVDGDVVNPGGIMSGGTQSRRGPGLLGRRRDWEETQVRLADLTRKREAKEAEQAHLRESITKRATAIRSAEQTIAQQQSMLADLEGQLRELAAEERSVQERLQAVHWDIAQLDDGHATSVQKRVYAQTSLQENEQKRAALEQKMADKRREMDAWDAAIAQAQERLTAVKVETATLDQERASIVHRRQEHAERVAAGRRRHQQLAAEIRATEESTAGANHALVATEQALAVLTGEVADYEAELATLRQQRLVVEAAVATAAEQVRDAQTDQHRVQEQLHRTQVWLERLSVELSHALERLGEQYRMTYEWAREHHPTPNDPDQARRDTDALRRRMESLGPVQLGTIEEWARLAERLTFLQRERDDLRDAQTQLQGVIADIDEEMARRFSAAFEQIRQEFEVAFRQLFQGGRADLQLTDADNVLSSGIEVIAQPPGKKLQNLNLLSGGERALTAMALLFAILRVRPVPFCVLDEVEAALDEANVVRFAQQLRRFAPDTQFIIITHRRGTMEEVDSLYGITMQEFGVSSLISVRLTDDTSIETA